MGTRNPPKRPRSTPARKLSMLAFLSDARLVALRLGLSENSPCHLPYHRSLSVQAETLIVLFHWSSPRFRGFRTLPPVSEIVFRCNSPRNHLMITSAVDGAGGSISVLRRGHAPRCSGSQAEALDLDRTNLGPGEPLQDSLCSDARIHFAPHPMESQSALIARTHFARGQARSRLYSGP
jgi:hypothetical protein